MNSAARVLPFLAWFPVDRATLKSDAVAGVTVALVLIPQSMAYAQLAGLPPVYGLYTALLPVLVGALFGSSPQLSTGPVAVVSLLTASALTPLAAQGSIRYVELALLLALMVGCMQFALGVFRMGILVNFLSHPVVSGFTSAAAIIIALSQLNRVLGVPMGRSSFFLGDIWEVLAQAGEAHWPSVAFGAGAFACMLLLRRHWPRLPGVLIVVTVATALSAAIGYEQEVTVAVEEIEYPELRTIAQEHAQAAARVAGAVRERELALAERRRAQAAGEPQKAAALGFLIEVHTLEIDDLTAENRLRLRRLRKLALQRATDESGKPRFHPYGAAPPAAERGQWRVRSIGEQGLRIGTGGEVVGAIPQGLPPISLPALDWGAITSLFSTALVIGMVGFMEAISVAKGIATRTRRRIDANQELIGQGLANILGSLSSCFPASGSFSRSAVNVAAGARTGLSSVFTACLTLLTLLLLTPFLYHLPLAVLAAVIMLAVIALVDVRSIRHAWKAQRQDGVAGAATFLATLAFAPHLDFGMLFGAGLALVLYLYRTMRPRVATLSRHPNGMLLDAELFGLPLAEHVVAVRFDGQLYFANVPYFEDRILELTARFPKVREILIVGDGINQIDASGEQVIVHLVQRLRASGVTLSFSGLKAQVTHVLSATGALRTIGSDNLFSGADEALHAILRRIDDPTFDPLTCPLQPPESPPGEAAVEVGRI